jgi:adhesin/invasin
MRSTTPSTPGLRARQFAAPRLAILALLGTTTLTACGKEVVASPTPGSLILVQGNNQQVQGGSELPNPVIIRVLSAEGSPIAKLPIGFSVVQGGGSVNPGSAPSDENGEVKVKWTVGPNEVAQLLRASVPGVEAVNVTAIALLPSDVIIAQGNNQMAKAGGPLPNPIVIRIVGPGNTPMKGIPVAFQVTAGGGLISPQSAITNALGEVTARWTLGGTAGSNSLAVSSGSLQPVSLLAIGQ